MIFTLKTLFTVACYGVRIFIEGSLAGYKDYWKYILDLAFIGIILLTYNLAQSPPTHGFKQAFTVLQAHSVEVNEVACSILVVFIAAAIWVLSIKLNKEFEKSLISPDTSKMKKIFYISASGFFAGALFYAGLLIQ